MKDLKQILEDSIEHTNTEYEVCGTFTGKTCDCILTRTESQIKAWIEETIIGSDTEVPHPQDEESRARFYRKSGQNFLRHQQRQQLREEK